MYLYDYNKSSSSHIIKLAQLYRNSRLFLQKAFPSIMDFSSIISRRNYGKG